MDQEFRYGLMVQDLKVNGIKVRLQVKEDFGMEMETIMRGNFYKTKLMAMVYTFIRMVKLMKEVSKTIFKKD
jgi:hypothetical protein